LIFEIKEPDQCGALALVFAVFAGALFILLSGASVFALLAAFALALALAGTTGFGGGVGSGCVVQNQAPKMIKMITMIRGANHFIFEISLSSGYGVFNCLKVM
jgi:hypothetical protein